MCESYSKPKMDVFLDTMYTTVSLASVTALMFGGLANGNVVGHINKVTLRRARLILRLMTVRRYIILACSQLSLLPYGRQEISTDEEAVLCSRKSNRRSGVAPAVLWYIHPWAQCMT